MLLVYLGQKSILSSQNSSVLESIMELLQELLIPLAEKIKFLKAKVDMSLLGWVVMYLCMCLDGVNCINSGGNEDEEKNNEKDQSKSTDKKKRKNG